MTPDLSTAIGGVMVAIIGAIGAVMVQRSGRVERQLNGNGHGRTIGQILESIDRGQDRMIATVTEVNVTLRDFWGYQRERNHDLLSAVAATGGLREILPELLAELEPGDLTAVLTELHARGDTTSTESVLSALAAVQGRRRS